jgi:peroxiredoxin
MTGSAPYRATHCSGGSIARKARLVCFAAGLTVLLSLQAPAQQAVDFTLKDLAGQSQTLSEIYPKGPVLLNFWATWCVPCAKELPHLQRMHDQYRESGFRVLAISVDGPDRLAKVSSFIGRYGYTFPVLLDPESKVVTLYNPQLVLPYSVLVDKNGRIRYAHQGYSPGDESPLEQKIIELLAEAEVKPKPKVSVQVGDSFLLRLPDEDSQFGGASAEYSDLINQLDLTLSGGRILAGARLDANLSFSPAEQDFRLAKRFAEYSTGRFRARAGDYYYSLGRGLVLSVVKIFEEEGLDYVIDTTIDGGLVAYDSGPLTAQFYGGWIDRPVETSTKDDVVGGSVGWDFKRVGKVRFNYAHAGLEPGFEFGNKNVSVGSLSLDIPSLGGRAKLYGEFSLIQRQLYDADEPVSGHGLYLESQLRLGKFSLLLELKDYKELNFEYSRPPLLEPEELDILADQFDEDRTDVSAVSARLDYYLPGPATLFYCRLQYLDDSPDGHIYYGSYNREIRHLFAGVEKKFRNGGYLNGLAGWRDERDTSIAFLSTDGQTFHYQINANWPLARTFSLEADWKHKVFDGEYLDYSEIRSYLSLHKSPRWVATVQYEWTDNPETVFFTKKNDFWAGELEVRFGKAHSVRLFLGSTKGSTKCAGGVCRVLPPFEGLRLEAVLRF